jgi:anti-sigma-K factor RskA
VNESLNHLHPDELLGAYALDALDDEEASLVEAHLEVCPQCRESVQQFQNATALLGLSVERQEPPPRLQSRVMNSLPELTLAASAAPIRPAARHSRPTTSKWVIPLAAAIVLSLFGVSLAMNRNVASRVDRLEEANSTVTAQLSQSMAQVQRLEQENSVLAGRLNQAAARDEQILSTVHQIQAASYLSSHPNTQPLVLEPPVGSSSGSQGVLLVGEGGQKALLMVSNMEQPPPLRSYQVWLVRGGQRMPVGQLQVDSSGWGSLYLTPPASLFEFEWVSLTVEERDSVAIVREKMVLHSRIPPTNNGR